MQLSKLGQLVGLLLTIILVGSFAWTYSESAQLHFKQVALLKLTHIAEHIRNGTWSILGGFMDPDDDVIRFRNTSGDDGDQIAFQKTSVAAVEVEPGTLLLPRNPQNIALQIKKLDSALKPFLDKIDHERSIMLQQDIKWTDITSPITLADGYKQPYFDIISKFPQVRTVYAMSALSAVSPYLASEYFNFTANDCERLKSKSIGGDDGPRLYGISCLTDVVESQKPRSLPLVALGTGLPESFPLNETNTALTFLHLVPSAYLKSLGDVYTGGLKILPQRCSQDKSTKNPGNVQKHKLYDEVFTIGQFWGSGFFHVFVENIPRIAPYIPFLLKHEHIKVHIHVNRGFTSNILNALGIKTERLIWGDIRAKILYMPAGNPCGRAVTFNGQLTSLRLRNTIAIVPEPRNSIVVIRRSSRRWFNNHDSIFAMVQNVAKEYGLNVELFSDKKMPSFTNAMAMFNRAAMVVAPHGAGLANLYFSEPGTAVLEELFLDGARYNLCYRNLMASLGHRYYGQAQTTNGFNTKPSDLEGPLRTMLNIIIKR